MKIWESLKVEWMLNFDLLGWIGWKLNLNLYYMVFIWLLLMIVRGFFWLWDLFFLLMVILIFDFFLIGICLSFNFNYLFCKECVIKDL